MKNRIMKEYFNRRNIVTASLLLIFLVLGAKAQTWEKLGDTPEYINFIFLPPDNPDMIIVGGDFFPTDIAQHKIEFFPIPGSGYVISRDRGKTFSENKLFGISVFDLLIDPFNSNNWYAAGRKSNRGGIATSKDGGETWNSIVLRCDATYQIMNLEYIPGNTKMFAGAAVNTSNGFIFTEDDFESCQQNESFNISSRDIVASTVDTNLIFMAGDNFHPGVFRSRDRGKTWERFNTGIEGLRIHSILPLATYADYVVCAADTVTAFNEVFGKGIYMSSDTGKTWHLAGAAGSRVFELKMHPKNSKYIAAACDSSGVWFSGAYGAYFKQASDGLPPNSSVRHIAIPDWEITNDGFIAIASVYSDEGIPGKGLYISKRVTTNIEDEYHKDRSGMAFESIFPSPVNEFVNICWYNPYSQNLDIRVCDMYGRSVYSVSKYFNKGSVQFRWEPEKNLSAAVYNIIIQSSTGNISKTIIKQ